MPELIALALIALLFGYQVPWRSIWHCWREARVARGNTYLEIRDREIDRALEIRQRQAMRKVPAPKGPHGFEAQLHRRHTVLAFRGDAK